MSLPHIPVASHWFNRFLWAGPTKNASVEGARLEAIGSEFSIRTPAAYVFKIACPRYTGEPVTAPDISQTEASGHESPVFQADGP